MTEVTLSRREKLHRRGVRLEVFTIAWNVVEAVVAIGAGVVAGSVALVGFGADSGRGHRTGTKRRPVPC